MEELVKAERMPLQIRIGAALVASLSQAAAIATEMQKGRDSRRKARVKRAGAHLGGSLGGHRIVMGIC